MSINITDDQTVAANLSANMRDRVNVNATHIDLFHKGKAFSFSKEDLPISIGRDASQCDIPVNSHIASRVHCSLVVQDDQIGVLDTSKNGTLIQIGRNEDIAVKDKFFPLIGQGHIQLGGVAQEESNQLLFKMRFE